MLTLEEAGRAKKAAQSFSAALVARSSDGLPDVPENSSSNRPTNGGKRNHNRNTIPECLAQHWRMEAPPVADCSRGGYREANAGDWQATARKDLPPYSPWTAGQQWPWMASWGPWAVPPCPYPSTAWSRPNYGQQQPPRAGVLGPRPQQAYTTAPTPTDIEAAMHTLGITPPDANWYMDTGATSHMTSTQGFSDGEAGNEV
ncbi:hypothetical protein R3W88_033294 [Solanum pinnatisectum]|uniref:Uncharacterized protein n=1 Tax=Solanum pinnatisectum TaxID=50273 RepID=A0AAV9K1K8_9SOLN|nr:hypothetical protein R3W88_033294 [Solanum pinnatisectum]